MLLNRYKDFLFESLILESIVVYSDKFKSLLKQIDSPVSQALQDIESKDIDVANNFIDVVDKEQISFIQDRKAKEIEKKVGQIAIYNGGSGFLKHSDANKDIFELLQYTPVGDKCYHPNSGDEGEVLAKATSPTSENVYLKIKFGAPEGDPTEGISVINQTSIRFPDPKELAFRQSRQNIRVGRGIRGLLTKTDFKFTDAEIERFVNLFKSEWDKMNDIFRKFEIVEGETIAELYNYRNYEGGGKSSLGQSCMRSSPKSFFDIYVKNPEVCKMLILKSDNEQGKIKGRAIVWTLDSPKITFMDRIYCNEDSDIELFRQYAIKMGWYYKKFNTSSTSGLVIGSEGEVNHPGLSVRVKPEREAGYDNFPYMDTLKYFNPDSGLLKTSADNKYVYTLEDTGGRYLEESCDSCGGSGRVSCYECDGDGRVDCPDCQTGSGRYRRSTGRTECPDCEGSGKEECGSCRGKGTEECQNCSGNGSVELEDGAEGECPDCSGSGEVNCADCNGDGNQDCSNCSGDGEVDCPECDGEARIRCSVCDGDGEVDCPDCN